MRIAFFPFFLLTATGCSTASLESTYNTTGEAITGAAGKVWYGAGRLWPAGVWPDGVWVADYERAEELASQSGQGVLYLYTQKDRTRTDELRDYLVDPATRGVAADYLPALLFQKNESDRRYAAQFGVQRAPAVILVHRDGTYHSTQGSLSPETVSQFFANSAPPGAAPTWNPYIARKIGYAWYRDWASAKAASAQTGRPIFVVLERWMSRDWDVIRPMVERREVQSRATGMIPCRPSTMLHSASDVAGELGVTRLPAVAVVPVTGEASVLELPNSYEAVVRFIDQATGRTPATAQAQPEPEPDPKAEGEPDPKTHPESEPQP